MGEVGNISNEWWPNELVFWHKSLICVPHSFQKIIDALHGEGSSKYFAFYYSFTIFIGKWGVVYFKYIVTFK